MTKIRRFDELFESYDLYSKSDLEKDCKAFFPDNAEEILRIISENKNSTITLQKINDLIGGYGVETLTSELDFGNYYKNSCSEFINMGNNMTVTIVYDVKQRKFLITSIQDFIQYYKIIYKII